MVVQDCGDVVEGWRGGQLVELSMASAGARSASSTCPQPGPGWFGADVQPELSWDFQVRVSAGGACPRLSSSARTVVGSFDFACTSNRLESQPEWSA